MPTVGPRLDETYLGKVVMEKKKRAVTVLSTMEKKKLRCRKESEVTDDQAHGQRQIPDNEIPLPNVTNKILGKVIEYCKKHIEANCADEKPNEDELRLGTLISSRLIRPLFSISFWGFTKFSRADYLKYKSESKIVPVGVNVKLLDFSCVLKMIVWSHARLSSSGMPRLSRSFHLQNSSFIELRELEHTRKLAVEIELTIFCFLVEELSEELVC
ncbi:hypothetical protein JHK82_042841 [Glycine max]|nr:hypothetical protein JHK82_042841 [Glycine max]